MTLAAHEGPRLPGERRRLCFYSMHIVNLYRDHAGGNVGGAEVQYSLLARELAKDHDVHVVTFAPVPADTLRVPPGITVHTIDVPLRRSKVARTLRILRHQWRVYKAVDADAYFQRGAGLATFTISLFAKLHRRPFIFHWASDANAKGPSMGDGPKVGFLYRMGRRWARWQVCQTDHQLSLLPPSEHKRAVVIPNVLDDRIAWRPGRGGDQVLWVGTIRPEVKRPDRFLDLAEALPKRRFHMVGELRGPPQFQTSFKARVARLPNVTWGGFTERAHLPAEYAKARCLVNVSDFEGFPNTFLEACASGVPVVSLNVDPNGLLAQRGAGVFCAGDTSQLPAAVESMFDNATWKRRRTAALAAIEAHKPAAAADKLRELLREATA